MRRIHVAIGPITARASWKWLGPHLSESLAASCTVRFFTSSKLPQSDVAFFIKNRPSGLVQQAIDTDCRIVYMPVDFYTSRAQIGADDAFLRMCSGLLVHSPSLATVLAPHHSRIWPVDHPNLYGLKQPASYRADGYLLWVGDFLNLPYLLRWHSKTRLPHELKILTNARRTSVGGMAMTLALARRLEVELDIGTDHVNGIPMYEWDAAKQQAMMAEAKAAVDIKGNETDFFQFTKPPTKAQQFIVSGIPFAVNPDSSIARDLHHSGFEVADVGDPERWFSHAYWKDTQAFSKVLGERLRPETVAQVYRNCLAEITAGESPVSRPPANLQMAVPPPPRGNNHSGTWRDLMGSLRILSGLGASWKDTAPHTVKKLLELYRSLVPGWVHCREFNPYTHSRPVMVTTLIDRAGPGPDAKGEFFRDPIPESWEFIVLQPAVKQSRITCRWKSVSRWPFRSTACDRRLAATLADGHYLAFVQSIDQAEISRIEKVVGDLEACPDMALIWWLPDHGADIDSADIDSAANFVIRRDVWRALQGYDHRLAKLSEHGCDIDLRHRAAQLGFRVESAHRIDPVTKGHPVATNPGTAGPRHHAEDEMVVYTAITSAYDRLGALDPACVTPARQIAFLDESRSAAKDCSADWEIRTTDAQEQDPVRRAKICKVRPDLYFPDARYSLWIDGNVRLIYPFDFPELIERFLGRADLCVFRHHARSCIYQEATACKQRRLDDPRLIDEQMKRYQQDGFPEHSGLHEAVVVLRRHTSAVRNFNETWWLEISKGSRRDQLSFNYALWNTGLVIAEFPLTIQEPNGLFMKVPHAQKRSLRDAAGTAVRTWIRKSQAIHFGHLPQP